MPQFEALKERFIQAGRDLVSKGVRTVVGGCGFMVLFQRELAESLRVPVYSSSLMQLPLIAQSLASTSFIGIITASGPEIACAKKKKKN